MTTWWHHEMKTLFWPFVWGIHHSTVVSYTQDQWWGALFSLLLAWISCLINSHVANGLRCHDFQSPWYSGYSWGTWSADSSSTRQQRSWIATLRWQVAVARTCQGFLKKKTKFLVFFFLGYLSQLFQSDWKIETIFLNYFYSDLTN